MISRPLALLILDGWGVMPPSRGNAISLAATPNLDRLMQSYPVTTVQAAGEAVGLPWGEMGNSEVGHLNIGAGKILYQALPRITRSISDGSFFERPALLSVAEHVKNNNSQLHLAGLVSSGGIHSFNEHLYALLEFCLKRQIQSVFVHAFLDGRDTPYNSAKNFVAKLERVMARGKIGALATLAGRFWAMDRDGHWDRTEKAYRAMVEGKSDTVATSPSKAMTASYAKKIYDEEFVPTALVSSNGRPVAMVQGNDAVIFFNFRSDRMRQIVKAFAQPEFTEFARMHHPKNLVVATMTEYEEGLPVHVVFPPEHVSNPLAKVLSDAGVRQLHIAETEKYAHVTFFLNGGTEKAFPNEDRLLVPSPRDVPYDQKPEMSGREITEKILQELEEDKHDVIIANFANADMVGHTGNLPAIVKAVEFVDGWIGQIAEAVLKVNGLLIVTADHGNAEQSMDLQTGVIDKEHTSNPVPFLVVSEEWEGRGGLAGRDLSAITPVGFLSDVAPTVLALLGIQKPAEMTGRTLLNRQLPTVNTQPPRCPANGTSGIPPSFDGKSEAGQSTISGDVPHMGQAGSLPAGRHGGSAENTPTV